MIAPISTDPSRTWREEGAPRETASTNVLRHALIDFARISLLLFDSVP
jgi:hypothetical protein